MLSSFARTCLGVFRLLSFVLLVIALVFAHGCMRLLGQKHWYAKQGFYKAICQLIGLRVRTKGTPFLSPDVPTVFLSNHMSYLDIMVLGSLLPVRFISKDDVANWPLFGFLCRLQNTVFMARKRSALEAAAHTLANLVGQGQNMLFFPEGTTGDGTALKNFKPGLVDAFYSQGAKAMVQPVAMTLQKVDGKPVDAAPALRERYAWWRPETTLVPHLWGVMRTWRFDMCVEFLPPLNPASFADRKALMAAVQQSVTQALASA